MSWDRFPGMLGIAACFGEKVLPKDQDAAAGAIRWGQQRVFGMAPRPDAVIRQRGEDMLI